MLTLRDYQNDMLEQARAHFRQGARRVLLQLATGGGKTAMALSMMAGSAARGQTSHFHVHRKELVKQTSATFSENGLEHGFVAAGWPMNGHARVVLAGVQTLVTRLDQVPPPEFVITDECHHITASTWERIFERYQDARHIGLSATPERLDGTGLQKFYDVMVKGPSTGELIRLGYLSPYKYFAPGVPDLVGCRTAAGDFNRKDIGELMNNQKIIGDVVDHYLRLARGKQGVLFAVNREHSRAMVDALVGEGVKAAHVDGETPDKERDRLDAAFRAGDIEVLSNVDLFGEGYDVPGLEYVGLVRPTKSLALFLQQVGRGLRIFPGKLQAVIADHAGNAFQHGMPDDRRMWSLEGRKKRISASADATPIRQCPTCYMVSYSTVRVCPGCGYEHATVHVPIAHEKGELFELERGVQLSEKKAAAELEKKRRKQEERDARTYGELYELAKARGYANPSGWARMRVQLRQNPAQRYARRA